jgi:DNA repair exonuclease SbcCD ATPase subunit
MDTLTGLEPDFDQLMQQQLDQIEQETEELLQESKQVCQEIEQVYEESKQLHQRSKQLNQGLKEVDRRVERPERNIDSLPMDKRRDNKSKSRTSKSGRKAIQQRNHLVQGGNVKCDFDVINQNKPEDTEAVGNLKWAFQKIYGYDYEQIRGILHDSPDEIVGAFNIRGDTELRKDQPLAELRISQAKPGLVKA